MTQQEEIDMISENCIRTLHEAGMTDAQIKAAMLFIIAEESAQPEPGDSQATVKQQPSNSQEMRQMLLPVRYAEKEGNGAGDDATAKEFQ